MPGRSTITAHFLTLTQRKDHIENVLQKRTTKVRNYGLTDQVRSFRLYKSAYIKM